LHHIFENFDDPFQLTVLNVRLRASAVEMQSKHEIVEVGRPRRNILLSYLLAYVDLHRQVAYLMKQRHFSAVVLSHIISPVVPLLVRGRPLVFDYKDVYSVSASIPYRQPLRFVVHWISRLFEEILFRCQMTIVVPTPSFKALLKREFGVSSSIITNGVNMEIFHPASPAERMLVRKNLGLGQDDFCVCFLGTIQEWLDLATVISAVESFPKAKLLLIGGSVRSPDYFQSILSTCEQRGLGRKIIAKGYLSQPEAAKILSASDAAIIPFRTDLSLSRLALPDKLFEYLASGVPVISTKLPDVVSMFGDVVHFYDNADELVGILRHLDALRETREHDLHESELSRKYDWKTIGKEYQDLLRKLIERRREGQNAPRTT
jgi:glycosyltransferase involved in cell wall biosynthesis